MFSANLLRSTYFRFASVLTGLFVLSYLVAGWIAFQAINDDLDRRVAQSAGLMSAELIDIYETGGRTALVDEVQARAAGLDPEDDFVWLGLADGTRLAGHPLASPTTIAEGDISGARLGQDDGDTFFLLSRDFDGLRLITARSYEETDEISSTVLKAFGGSTAFVAVFAALAAFSLSRRGQARIDQIAGVLRKVAAGDMQRRIDTAGHRDDLSRLSERINEALAQLEATVAGIRQVSADIAHDLRTPINRLGIQIERMKSDAASHPDLEPQLDRISAEIRQIAATFDALLRISQIEAGARRAKFRAVPLAEVAATLFDAYAAVAEDSGRTLLLNTPAESSTLVYGDRDLLLQLGANLIENAIRHTESDADIRLETGFGPNAVWLSVADNGPGIPPDEREHVTKRLYRIDKSRTTAGSGLGLALVKAIADLHGARLDLSDAKPGLIVRTEFAPFSKALKTDD